jgi:hypothetical protein
VRAKGPECYGGGSGECGDKEVGSPHG